MLEMPSRFILWFRMQSLRQDEVGDMVRAAHADPELLSCRMHSAVLRHLQSTEVHKDALPLFWEATQEYDRYHTRRFNDMPCLVCRASLTALPREEVDVIWWYTYGLESGTYFFLHKPCFMTIDHPPPFFGAETLDRLLHPQHGYKRLLTSGWWEALVRLWPGKKAQPRELSDREYDDLMDKYCASSGFKGYADPTSSRGRRMRAAEAMEKAARRGLALSTRFDILQRDQYRCRLCGAAARDGDHVRLEVDHIVARYRGGTDDASNLWTLCFACNRGKGTKDL